MDKERLAGIWVELKTKVRRHTFELPQMVEGDIYGLIFGGNRVVSRNRASRETTKTEVINNKVKMR